MCLDYLFRTCGKVAHVAVELALALLADLWPELTLMRKGRDARFQTPQMVLRSFARQQLPPYQQQQHPQRHPPRQVRRVETIVIPT